MPVSIVLTFSFNCENPAVNKNQGMDRGTSPSKTAPEAACPLPPLVAALHSGLLQGKLTLKHVDFPLTRVYGADLSSADGNVM